RPPVFGRPEIDIFHAERIENTLPEELVQSHAGSDFDDAAEGIESGLRAVGPAGAGLELQRRSAQPRNIACQIFFRPAVQLSYLAGAHGAAPQAGDVGQQIANGDLALGRHGVEMRFGGRAATATPAAAYRGRAAGARHLD